MFGLGSVADMRERLFLPSPERSDAMLMAAAAMLLFWGLIMVASASVAVAERHTGVPFHYFYRQLAFAVLGLGVGAVVFQIPMKTWEDSGFSLLVFALLILVIVFLPGIGREVNGAQRWIDLGPVNLQASEPARFCLVMYLASYVVRRRVELSLDFKGMVKPMVPLSLACALMLMEPDYGAVVILMAISLMILFLAGARLLHLSVLAGVAISGLVYLALSSPYRLRRLVSFANPWEDPYDSGFQLSQALIAIGRGEWFGVGLGSSVQKLLYLPETHTDFVYAVLAEETGLFGSLCLLGLFLLLIWRGFAIARRALEKEQFFAAYVCYGFTAWIGLQAFVNLAVNMGLLPTKGLTLPLMSYGGSSLVVMCMVLAVILRVDAESRGEAGDSKPVERPRVPGFSSGSSSSLAGRVRA